MRDHVAVGQKGVEVTVYGPKYWTGRRKTKDDYEDTVVKGYHAGFVKVPKHYREETRAAQDSEQPPKDEEPAPPEDAIRQQRQEQVDRRVEALREQAARLEEAAAGKQVDFNRLRDDIAFLTQPASPGSPFGRQRNNIMDRYDQGLDLQAQARDLRAKADRMEQQGVVVKGDKERARQQQREEMDKVVEKGTKIHDPVFGDGEVVRVNKKSYRIKFDRGFTTTRDKSYVQLREESEQTD